MELSFHVKASFVIIKEVFNPCSTALELRTALRQKLTGTGARWAQALA